jgi:hypothetical protein
MAKTEIQSTIAHLPGCEFLTDAQLCEMLGVTDRTTLVWRTNGGGPPYCRIGIGRGQIRYRLQDVEAWLAARTFPHRAAEAVQAVAA